MACCFGQLFKFTRRSQYYKNNGGIALGRPYRVRQKAKREEGKETRDMGNGRKGREKGKR